MNIYFRARVQSVHHSTHTHTRFHTVTPLVHRRLDDVPVSQTKFASTIFAFINVKNLCYGRPME